ncbi:DUF6924 domain-containing protein [Streptomyces roseofulvus]|uniref:DUF6924 domain-containing protein n=1 Tax=Streptomyces roseofulvus TaxID=33902 RepID=UPI0035F07F01
MVLRTDFGDEGAWDAVRAAFDAAGGAHRHATYVSELCFAGVEVHALTAEGSRSVVSCHLGQPDHRQHGLRGVAETVDESGTFRGFDES